MSAPLPSTEASPSARSEVSSSDREGALEALVGTVVSAVRWVLLISWSAFWITLASVLTLLTLRRDLALTLARVAWGPGVLWLAGAKFEVAPLPDIDWNRPYIFVMNHQSMLDIAAGFTAAPVKLRFVAKESIRWMPFVGWYMWMTGMIFVDRSNKRRALQSLAKAGKRIRAGSNIIMFPEGTRSKDGKILPFKKGPFVLATEAGVPLLPVAVHGTASVMPRTGMRLRRGTVRVAIGQPVLVEEDGRNREDLIRRVRHALTDEFVKLGGPGAVPQDIAATGQEGLGTAKAEQRGNAARG